MGYMLSCLRILFCFALIIVSVSMCIVWFLFIFEAASFLSPGCSGMRHAEQIGCVSNPEFFQASASCVLGLKVCAPCLAHIDLLMVCVRVVCVGGAYIEVKGQFTGVGSPLRLLWVPEIKHGSKPPYLLSHLKSPGTCLLT